MRGLVVLGVAAVVLSPPAAADQPRAVPAADPPLERAAFAFPPMVAATVPTTTTTTTTLPPPTTTTVVVTTTEPELEPAAVAEPEPEPEIIEEEHDHVDEPAEPDRTIGTTSGNTGWEALRQCESGGDYSTDTGNGYGGAYQFDQSTWRSVGGIGRPADASPAEQDRRAQMLYAARGAQPWPECGRHLR